MIATQNWTDLLVVSLIIYRGLSYIVLARISPHYHQTNGKCATKHALLSPGEKVERRKAHFECAVQIMEEGDTKAHKP